MDITTKNENDLRGTQLVRRAVTRLALAAAISSTALVITAEAAHARIAVNHNEPAAVDRP